MSTRHNSILRATILVWMVLICLYAVTRYYQLEWNVSGSMPQRLWFTQIGNIDLKVGDYVVIKFHDFRMKDPNDFEYVVKQVGGVAGDNIGVLSWWTGKVKSTNFALNREVYEVYDTLSGNHFTPLTTRNLIIPKGCYFLHGQHQPSFDSRYKEFGLICKNQIYGKTHPIF